MPLSPALLRRIPGAAPITMDRRGFLGLALATGAAALLPAGCHGDDAGLGYFTPPERQLLTALADLVLPPDADPGAAALGAVDYIERLLTAFDVNPPAVFAGGPFSGRRPYATDQGTVSDRAPPNDFARFLPLPRVSEAAWRLRLYGSAALPWGFVNDAVLGPVVGLRERLRSGLALAPAAVPNLDPDAPDSDAIGRAFNALPKDLRDTLVELILEGALAAPEYGGNRGARGWALTHYPGDSLPLGYSLYDQGRGSYHERPDAPVSTADSGVDPDPLDDDTRQRLALIAVALGGRSK